MEKDYKKLYEELYAEHMETIREIKKVVHHGIEFKPIIESELPRDKWILLRVENPFDGIDYEVGKIREPGNGHLLVEMTDSAMTWYVIEKYDAWAELPERVSR